MKNKFHSLNLFFESCQLTILHKYDIIKVKGYLFDIPYFFKRPRQTVVSK